MLRIPCKIFSNLLHKIRHATSDDNAQALLGYQHATDEEIKSNKKEKARAHFGSQKVCVRQNISNKSAFYKLHLLNYNHLTSDQTLFFVKNYTLKQKRYKECPLSLQLADAKAGRVAACAFCQNPT